MYKMFKISAETFVKNCVYNIIYKKKVAARNKDIGEKLGVQNIYDLINKEIRGKFGTINLTDKQIREYKRHGSELIDDEKTVHTHENIIIPIIMSCRLSTPKAIEFRSRLGFKQHDKEQSVISKITKFF